MSIENAITDLVREVLEEKVGDIAEQVQSNLDLDALREELGDPDIDRIRDELEYEARLDALEQFDLDDMGSTVEDLENRISELESHDGTEGINRDDLEGELRTFTGLSPSSRCSLGRAFADAVKTVVEEDVHMGEDAQVALVDAAVDNHPWFANITDRLQQLEGKTGTPVAPSGFALLTGRIGPYMQVVTGFDTNEEAVAYAAEAGVANWTVVIMSPKGSEV